MASGETFNMQHLTILLEPMFGADGDMPVGANRGCCVGNDRTRDNIGRFALDGEGWELSDGATMVHIIAAILQHVASMGAIHSTHIVGA
jgi:hypothetical protein